MTGALIVAVITVGLWLLGVSFAAGIAVKTGRDNSRRVAVMEDTVGESNKLLQKIANDMSWVKQYLNLNGSGEGHRRQREQND